MESCSKHKSVKQIKIYFIVEILQSSHLSRPGRGILCLSSFIWSGQGVAWVFVCGVSCPGGLLGIGFVV